MEDCKNLLANELYTIKSNYLKLIFNFLTYDEIIYLLSVLFSFSYNLDINSNGVRYSAIWTAFMLSRLSDNHILTLIDYMESLNFAYSRAEEAEYWSNIDCNHGMILSLYCKGMSTYSHLTESQRNNVTDPFFIQFNIIFNDSVNLLHQYKSDTEIYRGITISLDLSDIWTTSQDYSSFSQDFKVAKDFAGINGTIFVICANECTAKYMPSFIGNDKESEILVYTKNIIFKITKVISGPNLPKIYYLTI